MDPIAFRPELPALGRTGSPGTVPAAADFSSALKSALDGVDASQRHAGELAREFQLDNSSVSLEETMIASQKANISFQAVVQVRNKLVAAYQDIMNMSL